MSASDIQEKLTKNLTDAHSIEEQALVQLRRAPEIAGQPDLARDFEVHLAETERQEQDVRARLEARDAEPSTLKDLAGKGGGLGMAWFADLQPDSPVKLTAHAYSYEHMEAAAYELLRTVAERAGDEETAEMARRIGGEERQMAERLEIRFPDAVEAAVGELGPADLADQLDAYLSDAHAVELQALQLLETGPGLIEDAELQRAMEDHRTETAGHLDRIDGRLEARGATASSLKDAALRLGSLNLGVFFKAQPDTDAKLAGFAFAFEHLEIALYSMLAEVARRADDAESVQVAEAILAEERAAADRLGLLLEDIMRREHASQNG